MNQLRFVLEGKTPLLMHSPRGMKGAVQEITKGKNVPSPQEEAEASAYKLPNGDLCVPATAVRNCIITATSGYKLGKRALRPYVAGALLPADLSFPLVNNEGEPIRTYTVDTQRAVIQRQGILRSRARIDVPWNIICVFELQPTVEQDGIPRLLEFIKTCIGEGGLAVGILDYRVEKKGWYGMFRLKEFELIDTE